MKKILLKKKSLIKILYLSSLIFLVAILTGGCLNVKNIGKSGLLLDIEINDEWPCKEVQDYCFIRPCGPGPNNRNTCIEDPIVPRICHYTCQTDAECPKYFTCSGELECFWGSAIQEKKICLPNLKNDAVFNSYYSKLESNCRNMFRDADIVNCCIESAKQMQSGEFLLALNKKNSSIGGLFLSDSGCQKGFQSNALTCDGSYVWCQPEN